MNAPIKRESVRQQGSALGQSVVGPSFLDATFHRAQARLKSTPTAVIRAESSRPLFYRLCAGQGGIQDAVFLFAVVFIATNFIGG